jgi:tetratricopeptide (TPR) repeat protein
LAIGPDGTRLVSASSDGTIRFWSLADRIELIEVRRSHADVTSLAFSSDGAMLASGSDDNSVHIWSTESIEHRVATRASQHARDDRLLSTIHTMHAAQDSWATVCEHISISTAMGDEDRETAQALILRIAVGPDESTDEKIRELKVGTMDLFSDSSSRVHAPSPGLLIQSARAPWAEGRRDTSRQYLTQAVKLLRQRHPGPADSTLASALVELGQVHESLNRLADAETCYREALDLHRRAPDGEAGALFCLNALGRVVRMAGRAKEAEPYYREVYKSARRLHGENHLNTLIAADNLGVLLQELGDLDSAEHLFRSVLRKYKSQFGEKNEHSITAMNNLGTLLIHKGQLDEAEALLERSLELGRAHVEHESRLAQLVDNLGLLRFRQRDLGGAEALRREAVEILRRTEGDGHVDTIIAMSNLAAVLVERNKRSEATYWLVTALSSSRRVRGEEDPFTLEIARQLKRIKAERTPDEDGR